MTKFQKTAPKKTSDVEVAILSGHLYERVDGWMVKSSDPNTYDVGPFADRDTAFNYYKMLSGQSDNLSG